MSLRRQLRRVFSLLLVCLWITSASFAEHLSAEFPLCQPEHSPCCPLPVNNAAQSCPACQVTTLVAKKTESKSETIRFATPSKKAYDLTPHPLARASVRELTPGLRYHPIVFQLKDDLRI